MNQEEKALRTNIRHLIQNVKAKKANKNKKMQELVGTLVQHELKAMMMEASTPDVDPAPNKSTGINVLEELLKKIIPVLETDYKSLTTNNEQRKSFRAHIVNAVVGTLTPAQANNDASDQDLQEVNLDMDEDVDVNIGDYDPAKTPGSGNADDKFIDIRTDAERKAEEEDEEPDPRDTFGSDVDGDKTGRNMAYQSFKKIETTIIDSYELLGDPDDQELFYDYLIANLKLYFDKFEGELSGEVSEPTNQAYDNAKQDVVDADGDLGEPLQEFDIEI
tara:strand:+ start:5547 stop:6374 length:828 start_codon:yes stop_codon:yes gene_type:complete